MNPKRPNPFLLSYLNCLQKLLFFFLLIVCFGSSAQNSDGFKINYSSPDGIGRFQSHNLVNLTDNTTAIVGECTKTYSENGNMFLMKVDGTGKVLWAKQLSPSNEMDNYKICATKDGSIVIAENYVGNETAIGAGITMYKFTCSGQLVWSRLINLGTGSATNKYYELINMSEGEAGDILLSVMNYTSGDAIIGRLNAGGNLVWSKTFTGDGNYTHNAHCFYINNKVVVVGLKHSSLHYPDNNKNFFAMRLNYADGSIELKKDYHSQEFPTGNYGYVISSPNIHFNALPLTDNKLALGGLFYNFSTSSFFLYNLILDNNFSLLSSTGFVCPLDADHDGEGYHKTIFFPNGDVNIIGYNPYGDRQINWYTADKQYNIKKQITVPYVADVVDMDFTVAPHGSDGYSLLSSYFDYTHGSTPHISFAVAKDNDLRIKNCLGTDTAFVSLRSWSVNPNSWNWNSITDNQLVVAAYPASVSDITINFEYNCSPPGGPIIIDDYLKIKGDSSVCSLSGDPVYNASSNMSNPVTWTLSDSSFYQSATLLNDSAIQIRFNRPDTGVVSLKLYAKTGDCKTLRDTTTITIYPKNHELPGNMTICRDSFRLQPGRWFKSYRWQDGTTDSFYVVKQPGIYWVELTDFCGNSIKDTSVFVSKSSGKHYTKSICKGDSITLEAPAGLTNYQWTPDADLHYMSDSIVEVYSSKNTTYYLSAMTSEGCMYSDTNTLTVNSPAYLNLGKDTSICIGDIIILNGGNGFVKYIWNTGDSTKIYKVTTPGLYSLNSEDQNGCFATDTILISRGDCSTALNLVNVPSAFTPNNDGINDVFKPIVEGNIISIEFAIYNRWGQMIFKTNKTGEGWNGTLNGTPQTVDVYIWTCSYKFKNDIERVKKGIVTLIR